MGPPRPDQSGAGLCPPSSRFLNSTAQSGFVCLLLQAMSPLQGRNASVSSPLYPQSMANFLKMNARLPFLGQSKGCGCEMRFRLSMTTYRAGGLGGKTHVLGRPLWLALSEWSAQSCTPALRRGTKSARGSPRTPVAPSGNYPRGQGTAECSHSLTSEASPCKAALPTYISSYISPKDTPVGPAWPHKVCHFDFHFSITGEGPPSRDSSLHQNQRRAGGIKKKNPISCVGRPAFKRQHFYYFSV